MSALPPDDAPINRSIKFGTLKRSTAIEEEAAAEGMPTLEPAGAFDASNEVFVALHQERERRMAREAAQRDKEAEDEFKNSQTNKSVTGFQNIIGPRTHIKQLDASRMFIKVKESNDEPPINSNPFQVYQDDDELPKPSKVLKQEIQLKEEPETSTIKMKKSLPKPPLRKLDRILNPEKTIPL